MSEEKKELTANPTQVLGDVCIYCQHNPCKCSDLMQSIPILPPPQDFTERVREVRKDLDANWWRYDHTAFDYKDVLIGRISSLHNQIVEEKNKRISELEQENERLKADLGS